MKAKEGVVEQLNILLTIELTAINQYFLQAEMCKNWGFDRLYEKLRESSMDEMQDAQMLVRHILYLEGVPNLQMMGRVLVGETVPENLQLDLDLERNAVAALKTAVEHCANVGDYTTRNMLETGMVSEEQQIDWLETQLGTINLIGVQNYLAQQLK